MLYYLSFRFCVLFSVFAIFSSFVFSFFSHFVPFLSFLSSLVWLVWNAFCRLSYPVRLASHSLMSSFFSTPLPVCFVVCDHEVLCWSMREKWTPYRRTSGFWRVETTVILWKTTYTFAPKYVSSFDLSRAKARTHLDLQSSKCIGWVLLFSWTVNDCVLPETTVTVDYC